MDGINKGEILILGMGNKFFGDDGVGIVVAEKLESILADNDIIDVEETNWGGLRIIDLLSGYKTAIVIDALRTGTKPAGYIHTLDYTNLIHSVRMVSFHDVNFATAVELARELSIPMPENISVYAIEINESECFSEELTKEVSIAVDNCIQMVIDEIGEVCVNKKNLYKETV
jgi:hydrogenase maturation protease